MLPTFQLAACNLSAQTHSQRGALNVSAGIFSILSAWPGDRSSLRLARRIAWNTESWIMASNAAAPSSKRSGIEAIFSGRSTPLVHERCCGEFGLPTGNRNF